MFKTVDEAIHFIESQRAKRSFEDFQKIIERYQIPIDLKNVIHVAGTNGKGSTVTFIKDLLMKQGYHVGTLLHLILLNIMKEFQLMENLYQMMIY